MSESDTDQADCPVSADVEQSARFVCPITHLSCLRYPFVAISKCGHAFSDRAIKQVRNPVLVFSGCLYVAKFCACLVR